MVKSEEDICYSKCSKFQTRLHCNSDNISLQHCDKIFLLALQGLFSTTKVTTKESMVFSHRSMWNDVAWISLKAYLVLFALLVLI